MRNRDQGFTLLELVMVVLIISLTLALSYPALSRGSAAIHLRTAARGVLSTFRYAREKAVTEQTGMCVAIYKDKQEFVLTDSFGDGNRKYVLPQDVKIQRVALAGTEITEGPLVVRFLPNGSTDNTEVVLKSDAGSFYRIITDPITGGARVEQGLGENSQ